MKLEWTFTATSYLDQLSSAEKSRVTHAVERLRTDWDILGSGQMHRLEGESDVYSLRVGSDLRVLLRRQDEAVVVLDVVRRSQVEALRRLAEERHALPG